jgi:hypothetical protein
MSRSPIGGATTDGSGSTTILPSALDTKAWQTALAEADKGKGPLTPAAFDYNGYKNPPTGYQVIQYGHDNNTGTADPHGAATALAVFGDSAGPQGIVFLDRATNTATVTYVDPRTGRPASAPETIKDVAGNLVVPPGLKGDESTANQFDPYATVTSIGLNMGNDVVDIGDDLDGWGNGPAGTPSTGIGVRISTPPTAYGYVSDISVINSDGNQFYENPDPTDTSRMLATFSTYDLSPQGSILGDFPHTFTSESPALPQKPAILGRSPSGVLSRYDAGPSFVRYEP